MTTYEIYIKEQHDIMERQQQKAIHNATLDYTEKDAANSRWNTLKGEHQLTIFERQERRRREIESAMFWRDVLEFVRISSIVGAIFSVAYIAWLYSNELQAFFK